MSSFSLPSAQAGYEIQLGKRKMEDEEQEDGQSEATVDGSKPFLVKRRWNRHEDAMLLKHISVHGSKHWKLISDQLLGRSPASCRMRWWGQLCPKLLKIYKEMKQKSQGTSAVPPPTPIFTIRTRVAYVNYLNRILDKILNWIRFWNRIHLQTSSIQQQEISLYQPQPWSPSPPPPPPPSPSSPPTL